MDTSHLRQAGYRAKLTGLVGRRFGDVDGTPGTFPGGASLRQGERGWVLAEDRPERALGAALAWAWQHGVSDLHVLAAGAAGAVRRRAEAFSRPPTVWHIEGDELAPASPEPLPPPPPLPPEVGSMADVLVGAGAEPVVEHGTLVGEVLGLEVVRVAVDDDGPLLEVGVGKYDRMAQKELHGDRPTIEALADAVAAVRSLRRPGAPSHEVNRLAKERWLRAVVVARPELAGAQSLEPRPTPVLRTDLRQRAPAPAAGVTLAGEPVVVVCSTGIDVDLVPVAADARLAEGGDALLRLVVPEGDDHPVTRHLAASLRDPAEVLTVEKHWHRLYPSY